MASLLPSFSPSPRVNVYLIPPPHLPYIPFLRACALRTVLQIRVIRGLQRVFSNNAVFPSVFFDSQRTVPFPLKKEVPFPSPEEFPFPPFSKAFKQIVVTPLLLCYSIAFWRALLFGLRSFSTYAFQDSSPILFFYEDQNSGSPIQTDLYPGRLNHGSSPLPPPFCMTSRSLFF